jgi:prepilin-type N-terminal cleavage/methylation domain-containing protein
MNNKGFSLIELIVAMATGLVIMGAIYAVTEMGQRTSVAVERKIVAQQDARAALDIMALEIGMASCNPTFASNNMWCNPATCNTPPVNPAYRGIQEATATSITVEMDLNENSQVNCTPAPNQNPNEIIRYVYQPTSNPNPNDDGWISRNTSCGGALAFLGDQVGNAKEIRVVNQAAGVPLFTYYDGAGTELVPVIDLPARIPDIRRIKITLVVETEAIDRSLNKRRRTICSTNTLVRNHAINF